MNILITGSTSGIGRQLALDYLEAGHHVYCCGRNREALTQLSERYPDLAHTLTFDVQDLDSCAAALGDLPDLDLVILNAGTCEYIDAERFDAESFARVMAINVQGVANCLQYTIDRIRPGGVLGLMGSSSSFLPLPRAEAYGASKAAIEYLARTLSVSLKHKGIHVSYIAPGFVETPLTDRNTFPMPMRVDVSYASRCIRDGLSRQRRTIHFPRLFTGLLSLLGKMPLGLQLFLVSKTLKSQ